MGKKSKKGRKGSNPSPKKFKPSKDHSTTNGESAVPSSSKTVVYRSVPGLTNLGNTCFFNAVMQSLSQSHYLRLRLQHLEATPTYEQTLQIPSSEKVLKVHVTEDFGPLTTNLKKFLRSMQEKSAGTLNPRPVFSEICKKASRFSSHAQQDSQELLHHLLDAVRLEEIHRIKHAILVHFGLGKNGTASKNVTDEKRDSIKAYGRQAAQCRTFVDEVFGGILVSTVTCDVCKSCTKVQETFLDLSLPVSDDKSRADYRQDKNKKNQQKLVSGNNFTQTETTAEVEERESGKKISKHQKKKMERDKRKADKKAAQKKKTAPLSGLKQLIESSSLPDDPTPSTITSGVTDSPPSPIPSDHESSDDAGLVQEPGDGVQHGERVNPATGEHSCDTPTDNQEGHEQASDTPTTNEEGQEQENGPIDVEAIATATSIGSRDQVDNRSVGAVSDMAREYASSGPQTDVKDAPTNEVASNTTGTAQVDDNLNTRNNTERATGDDVASHGASVGLGGSVGRGIKEKEEEHTTTGPLAPEPEPDSVARSLKDFCATERLEGENQFACIQCTNEAIAEKKAKQVMSKVSPKEKPVKSRVAREDSNGNVCEGDDVVMEPDSSCAIENSSSDRVEGDLEGDGRLRNVDGSASEEEDDLSAGMEEKEEDYLSDIKFCDATKQLLIQTPPIVLTLHMKRFSQHGRQLRKNGKHIKFPFLLDISQYCVDTGNNVMCDGSGHMLYSLVAVVEHSGSMFGGHYVAYVKQRPPVSTAQLEQTCTWRVPHPGSGSDPSAAASEQITSPDNSVAPSNPSLKPDNSLVTPSTSSPAPDNSTMVAPSSPLPTPDNSMVTPSSPSPTPDDSMVTPSSPSPTPDDSITPSPATHDGSTCAPDNTNTPLTLPTTENSSVTPKATSPAPDNSALTPTTEFPLPNCSASYKASPDDSTHSCDDTKNIHSSPTIDTGNTLTSTPDNSIQNNLPSTPDDSITTCDSSPSTDKSTPAGSPGQQTEPSNFLDEEGHCKEFDETAAEGQWYHVSDSHVTKSSPEDVQRSQAYLLFYELLPFRTS